MTTTPETETRAQAETIASTVARIPKDFRKTWKLFDNLSSTEIVDSVIRDYDTAPAERRDVLTAFLSKRLGYSRFSRRARLTSRPLWDVLSAESFDVLDAHDRDVLWLIAQTTAKVSTSMHPKAALAAIALWRNGKPDEREKAQELIETEGLPTSSEWLYALCVELLALDQNLDATSVVSLARIQVESNHFDSAALMAGIALVALIDPWRVGSIRPNLIRACDRASQEFPREFAPYLDVIADAAIAGQLRSSWMERPMRAAIRLAIDEPERELKLRGYYATRPFEVSPARLQQLFEYPLSQIQAEPTRVLPELLREVHASVDSHPVRSIHLLELMVERMNQTTLPELAQKVETLDPYLELLVRLYVRSFHLDQHAVVLVRRFFRHPALEDISEQRFENYFVICDYEHSFGNRSATVLGSDISHLDKDTAAKVRYFQTGRAKPNSVTKLLATFNRDDWVITRIMEAEPVGNSIEYLFEEFLELVSGFDFSSQVVRDVNLQGAKIETVPEVAQLPIKYVERAIDPKKSKRMMAAAISGAVTGSTGPISLGLSTVVDVPILLYIAAETCSRYCWYYGFDPNENEDIIAMILGVTLQGSNIQSVKYQHVRADLRRMFVRRSIALGALSNGAALQLLAPTLGEIFVPSKGFFKNKKSRIVEFGLPTICGAAGMAVNLSFVYDLCESARWVLTDRFLARKYPGWESRF